MNDSRPPFTEVRTITSPTLDCEVCSRWIVEIKTNHNNPHGKIYWKNSEPHLWSEDKWEVAKVYMAYSHKKHKSIGDSDIAALLCLMTQCTHFEETFKLGGLCAQVSSVRNNIMHFLQYQLEQVELHMYAERIKALGAALAQHELQFQSLSEEIDIFLVLASLQKLWIGLNIEDLEKLQQLNQDTYKSKSKSREV